MSVSNYKLTEMCDSLILRDLIRSFETERSLRPVGPPSWDLVKVLDHFRCPFYEPLASKLLKVSTMKTLILLSLATLSCL